MSEEAAMIPLTDESQQIILPSIHSALDQDAAFLATWPHDKSEKTRRANEGDIRKFYVSFGKPLAQVKLADGRHSSTHSHRSRCQARLALSLSSNHASLLR